MIERYKNSNGLNEFSSISSFVSESFDIRQGIKGANYSISDFNFLNFLIGRLQEIDAQNDQKEITSTLESLSQIVEHFPDISILTFNKKEHFFFENLTNLLINFRSNDQNYDIIFRAIDLCSKIVIENPSIFEEQKNLVLNICEFIKSGHESIEIIEKSLCFITYLLHCCPKMRHFLAQNGVLGGVLEIQKKLRSFDSNAILGSVYSTIAAFFLLSQENYYDVDDDLSLVFEDNIICYIYKLLFIQISDINSDISIKHGFNVNFHFSKRDNLNRQNNNFIKQNNDFNNNIKIFSNNNNIIINNNNAFNNNNDVNDSIRNEVNITESIFDCLYNLISFDRSSFFAHSLSVNLEFNRLLIGTMLLLNEEMRFVLSSCNSAKRIIDNQNMFQYFDFLKNYLKNVLEIVREIIFMEPFYFGEDLFVVLETSISLFFSFRKHFNGFFSSNHCGNESYCESDIIELTNNNVFIQTKEIDRDDDDEKILMIIFDLLGKLLISSEFAQVSEGFVEQIPTTLIRFAIDSLKTENQINGNKEEAREFSFHTKAVATEFIATLIIVYLNRHLRDNHSFAEGTAFLEKMNKDNDIIKLIFLNEKEANDILKHILDFIDSGDWTIAECCELLLNNGNEEFLKLLNDCIINECNQAFCS